MAENINADTGLAEDLVRAFVQVGCAEVHAKTIHEKLVAELDNGLVDLSNKENVSIQIEHINDVVEEIGSLAELRRSMMRKLQSMFPEGDKHYWCMVKHLGIAAYTAFEVYQASEDDTDLLNMWIEANNRFTKALTHFLGIEITECAACLSDAMKGEKHVG